MIPTKIKSYDKFDSKEFDAARSLAKTLYSEGTNSGKIASNLIILNVLEELLSLFMDYAHTVAMLKVYQTHSKFPEIKVSYYSKLEPSDNKEITQTLGWKIKYIEDRFYFENKESLLTLLKKINQHRTKAIHKMLPSGHFRNDKLLLENCKAIYENTEKSLDLIFDITDTFRTQNLKSK